MVDFPRLQKTPMDREPQTGKAADGLPLACPPTASVSPFVPPAASRLDESLVDAFALNNARQRLSQSTRRRYKSIVRAYNQFLSDNGLLANSESLVRYFDHLSKKRRPSTMNLHKSALLKCFKAQVGAGDLLKNLAIEKTFEQIAVYRTDKSVSRSDCLTETQIRAMIQSAPTKKTALIIQFLYKTGCRVSEMIQIRRSDCELANGEMRIRITGKGLKERKVSIPLALYREIRSEYGGSEWLFESSGGKPLNRHNVGHQVRRAAEKIGVSDFYPHLLRHSRATDMLKNKGISLKAVSKFLGHANVAITAEMYVHDEVNYPELWRQDSV
jgi:integrase/recombinase XerD